MECLHVLELSVTTVYSFHFYTAKTRINTSHTSSQPSGKPFYEGHSNSHNWQAARLEGNRNILLLMVHMVCFSGGGLSMKNKQNNLIIRLILIILINDPAMSSLISALRSLEPDEKEAAHSVQCLLKGKQAVCGSRIRCWWKQAFCMQICYVNNWGALQPGSSSAQIERVGSAFWQLQCYRAVKHDEITLLAADNLGFIYLFALQLYGSQ